MFKLRFQNHPPRTKIVKLNMTFSAEGFSPQSSIDSTLSPVNLSDNSHIWNDLDHLSNILFFQKKTEGTFEFIIDFIEFQKIFLQKVKVKFPFMCLSDVRLTEVFDCLHDAFV